MNQINFVVFVERRTGEQIFSKSWRWATGKDYILPNVWSKILCRFIWPFYFKRAKTAQTDRTKCRVFASFCWSCLDLPAGCSFYWRQYSSTIYVECHVRWFNRILKSEGKTVEWMQVIILWISPSVFTSFWGLIFHIPKYIIHKFTKFYKIRWLAHNTNYSDYKPTHSKRDGDGAV